MLGESVCTLCFPRGMEGLFPEGSKNDQGLFGLSHRSRTTMWTHSDVKTWIIRVLNIRLPLLPRWVPLIYPTIFSFLLNSSGGPAIPHAVLAPRLAETLSRDKAKIEVALEHTWSVCENWHGLDLHKSCSYGIEIQMQFYILSLPEALQHLKKENAQSKPQNYRWRRQFAIRLNSWTEILLTEAPTTNTWQADNLPGH